MPDHLLDGVGGVSMRFLIAVLVLVALLVIPVYAADENLTNVTNTTPFPVVLSFTGIQAFGTNPVQIIDNSTGEIVFIGNTSSRNIQLPDPDGQQGYTLRIEKAGLSDAANNPDYAFVSMLEYAGENPVGCVALVTIISALISSLVRRRKNV
jgi:hypothetical protein